jgi:hypothetical protein
MNTLNLRTNVVFGHDMELPKPDNTTRLVSLNVNGFCRGDDYQDVLETAQSLKTSSSNIAAFSKTNTDWWTKAAKGKIYEKVQRIYHQARISTSSSIIRCKTLYQPGGTLTMVTDKYTGRVQSMGQDGIFGRWSYITMIGKQGQLITVVTIYNVCNQQGTRSGHRTAHMQQLSLLIRQGRTVQPREAFLDDFDQQVKSWIEAGHELIIGRGH